MPLWHSSQPRLLREASSVVWSIQFRAGSLCASDFGKSRGTEMGGPKPTSSEAPSTKLQHPEKHQAPSTKLKSPLAHGSFEVWCLEFLWSLELGIWSFLIRTAQ